MKYIILSILTISISAAENNEVFYAVGECTYNSISLEDEAREKAIQRAIRVMAIHRSASVQSASTDSTVVSENNDESNVESNFATMSKVATNVNIQKTWIHKSQVFTGDIYRYRIELAIKMDDLFPERKIVRAVRNNDIKALRSLISEYQVTNNEDLLVIAWHNLYQIDRDNPNTIKDYITYLYRNGCYEEVVITASNHDISDRNYIVRMSAQKLLKGE